MNKRYKSLNELTRRRGNLWYNHYRQYLQLLTYQLFEWKNLPETIDPAYLEKELHDKGYVAFYNDDEIGEIVTGGTISGKMNHYNLPLEFQAVSPTYYKTFPLAYYSADDDDTKGVLIKNNDLMTSTTPSLELFAMELTELKEIISINQNAQKTPVLISTDERTQLSMKNIYNKYEGNAPVIIVDNGFDADAIKVFKTDAPYVVDKLNTQKNAVWNELMTFLGIDNANLEKKERMITSEAESNEEQIETSRSIMLKSRKEACELINRIHGTNISVDFRQSVIDKLEKEVNDYGKLYDAPSDDDRTTDAISE